MTEKGERREMRRLSEREERERKKGKQVSKQGRGTSERRTVTRNWKERRREKGRHRHAS